MAEEVPIPAIWQRVIEEVKKARPGTDGPYQAMQLYLDIEERSVRLAAEMLGHRVATYPRIEERLTAATMIARHLRTRLGLPEAS